MSFANTDELFSVLRAEAKRHPAFRPADVGTLLYENEFGPAAVRETGEELCAKFKRAMSSVEYEEEAELYEFIGNGRYRLNLAALDPKPTIVSGLALGIDGCAHGAALESGLPTVAVLPCGLDEIYPRQHGELAGRIAENGALVSDFARGTAPVAFTFLRRNRIIAALADATLLAESYRKGGGLITMSLAASYNRDCFAVPGRLSDASFEGCNRLIAKQEAVLVADEDTIPDTLGWPLPALRQTPKSPYRPEDSPQRKQILQLLQEHAPLTPEDLSVRMGIPAREATVLLLSLEMEGRIVADGNNFFLSL